jgi:serine/threonine-protein kinase
MTGSSSHAERRAATRLGAVLRGKYTLERVLGVGGTAAVYLGVHRNGHRVAVKILHPELSIDDDVRARFLREGYAANSIGHAGAVRVLDDDVAEDGAAFLVMELLEGETLEQRRQRLGGRLPLSEVLALGHQLLDVLAAAHDKGVVHRDVKPDNLFLTRGRELKVLDFGIARLTDASGGPGTWSGSRIGTPAFMPPEQALGRAAEVDARSDVWAAGATLFTLCSGRLVHEAGGVAEIVVRTATQPARSLAEAAPDVPGEVVAVVDRSLAFAPADRFQTAPAMRDAIAAAFATLYGEPPSAAAIGEVPEAPRAVEAPAGAGPEPTVPVGSVERRASPTAVTLAAGSGGKATPDRHTSGSLGTRISQPEPPLGAARSWVRTAAVAAAGGAMVALIAFAMRPSPPHAPAAASASAAASAPRGCTESRACVAASGGKPAICRKEDGACVPLESADCHLLAEPSDIGNDATLWIGAMFPTSGPEAPRFGELSMRAVDLARRDFVEAAGGLPPVHAGAPKRPIAVIACDDRVDAERVATHLVDEVRVPAVIGFARSREVADLAASHFNRRGVLALASNTASMLRNIPHAPGEPRLVWRTTTSADMVAAPSSALVNELIEPALRKDGLRPGEAMRVAIGRVDNPSGQSYAHFYATSLRYNGRAALENGEAFRQILLPDQLSDQLDAPTVRRAADEILALAPHVVVDAGGLTGEVLREVEERWPEGRTRPRWVWASLEDRGLHAEVRARPELRARLFGVETPSATPAIAHFALRYNELFSPKITAASATSAPYDAFYLFAFAALAAGDQPLTGKSLARAIPRLLPPGEPVEVGQAGIYPVFAALGGGRNIDLQGTITTLDFDPETGDATADFAVYCFSEGDDLRVAESGLTFDAKTRRLRGTLRCPAPR